MLASDTPSSAALLRSTCTKVSTPLSLWSSSTSVSGSICFMRADSLSVQAFRSAALSAFSVYW